MTAVSLAEVLQPAVQEGYALAGLVVLGWEDALAFVEAAEEADCPVILQAGPGCRAHTPVPVIGKMLRHLADQAQVPVVCHLDHGYSVDDCRAGIDHGFTSVMFDGSRLPISENVELTAGLAEEAHAAGVSVEGEVGFVGYAEGAASAYTDPEEAARFDRESGADAIAISVGNVHLQTEKTDGIDFNALSAIEQVTSKPLVLHGGSGIPPEIRRKLARETRICKFNLGTELRQTFGNSLRQVLNDRPDVFDRIEILKGPMPAMKRATLEILNGITKL
ncbi:MAG: class II fructose-bisphosphate aldolase [Roseibium sp.]|uniref:class II fructose-bisphosphate aldolase n=1 Tax=Roseibium sp. TaxID=1936156 RepID=UPI001B2A5422|nr:class II fructose-bisphosphate aldolase [Roseibium sp.]MBO6895401.1 class II fructose-bisphosphate aldolase [Roseibium sp.]MBO6932712.1 class II fructose-bisphosphate aldolase [Roseibium sp.]